jgi:hypothetical protein
MDSHEIADDMLEYAKDHNINPRSMNASMTMMNFIISRYGDRAVGGNYRRALTIIKKRLNNLEDEELQRRFELF